MDTQNIENARKVIIKSVNFLSLFHEKMLTRRATIKGLNTRKARSALKAYFYMFGNPRAGQISTQMF